MAIASIVVRHEGTELIIFDETIRTPCVIYVQENVVDEVITILRGKGITDFSVEGIPWPLPPYMADLTNVFIGHNAGAKETGSNKLYIANTNTETPLIYGEFDNQTITINGDLTVTGLVDIGTITMDHADLQNTHNLTTDIDHNSITNTHNLTTDIDHNQLTNYVLGQHRVINDSGITNYELWSAFKIDGEIDSKISAASGTTLAPLSAGKISSTYLPDLALTKVTTYANEAAMIADSSNNQEGDVGILDDSGYAYMRNSNTNGDISDWSRLALGGTITSVNGDTGPTITLTADNIGDGTTKKMFLATERTKLTGIADNANNYTHPSTHPPSIIAETVSDRFVSDIQINKWTNATRLIVDSSNPGGANNATGTSSIVIGDAQTITSCNYSIISGGILNTISGGSTYASIIAGTQNVISSAADMSTIINGNGSAISHKRCTTIGSYAKSNMSNTFIQSNSRSTSKGDAQTTRLLMKNQTTNASSVYLYIESTQVLTMPQNTTWAFVITIVARQVAGSAGNVGDSWVYRYKGAASSLASTNFFVGSPAEELIAASAGAAGWSSGLASASMQIPISVTGEVNKTINWVATVDLYEVA